MGNSLSSMGAEALGWHSRVSALRANEKITKLIMRVFSVSTPPLLEISLFRRSLVRAVVFCG